MERGSAALFLDPGLGKTSIVLEAIRQMKNMGQIERVLVVAPLRVCQLVWRQEGKKWSQFRDLTFSLIHGTKKVDRLHDKADIHLINPEGIPWLMQQFFGNDHIPWDTVVIDELTKFKNHKAARSKKLLKKLKHVRRRWGLTGSPAPNGYMDIFGQMLMLDDGASLGRYITHYRDLFFQQSFNGFDFELRKGSAERIEQKITPYVLRMAAADYLDLPPLRDNIITLDLPSAAKKQYEEMKRDMLLALPEGIVTGANSGAVYSKLKQMANGAVYLSEKDKEYAEIHDEKLLALEELIEELAGQPVLVAYEFQHDLIRLKQRLGEDTPTLSGLSEKRITEVEAQWNRGELPILLVHPASVGHGLNLQEGGASHICWFSRPWDLEMYEQTIRRLLRQGSTAKHIMNHVLSVRGTMDEIVGEALEGKDVTQQKLLSALNAEIMRDNPAPTAAGSAARREEDTMVKKLGFRSEQEAAPAAAAVTPKGWGSPAAPVGVTEEVEDTLPPTGEGPSAFEDSAPRKVPAGWGAAVGEADEQRTEIRAKLSAPEVDEDEDEGPPPAVRALQAFGAGIVEKLTGSEESSAEAPQGRALPAGWGAAPETDGAGETAEDTWGTISTRYANALQQAGFASPQEAHSAGKGAALKTPRFGQKGWDELEEIFGAEQNVLVAPAADETPAESAERVEDAQQALKERAAATHSHLARMTSAPGDPMVEGPWAERAHEFPHVNINISIAGMPREAIAQLFAALATQYGS